MREIVVVALWAVLCSLTVGPAQGATCVRVPCRVFPVRVGFPAVAMPIAPSYQMGRMPIAPSYQMGGMPIAPSYQMGGMPIAPSYQMGVVPVASSYVHTTAGQPGAAASFNWLPYAVWGADLIRYRLERRLRPDAVESDDLKEVKEKLEGLEKTIQGLSKRVDEHLKKEKSTGGDGEEVGTTPVGTSASLGSKTIGDLRLEEFQILFSQNFLKALDDPTVQAKIKSIASPGATE